MMEVGTIQNAVKKESRHLNMNILESLDDRQKALISELAEKPWGSGVITKMDSGVIVKMLCKAILSGRFDEVGYDLCLYFIDSINLTLKENDLNKRQY